MKPTRLVAIAILLATVCLLLPAAATAAPAGWIVSTIDSGSVQPYQQLAISGARIAYLDGGFDGHSLYTQLLGVESTPTWVTASLFAITNVAVSGNRLAWCEWTLPTRHFQVFTRKIGADLAPVQLTTGTVDHTDVALSGDRLVWLAPDATGTVQGWSMKIGADFSPVQETAAWGGCSSIRVSGDRIAYVTEPRGPYWYMGRHLYTRDLNENYELELAGNPATLYPMKQLSVSGDHVVWLSVRPSADNFMHAFGVGLSSSVIATDFSGESEAADVVSLANWDGHTVWADSAGTLFSRREGIDQFGVPIASSAASPNVCWDRIVWIGSAAAPGVFTEKRGVDSTPIALAENSGLYSKPVAYGDYVVFSDGVPAADHTFSLSWAHPDWTPKLVTPWVDVKPNVSSMTVSRYRGVAQFTIGAVMGDPNGKLLAGKAICLQVSYNNGASWTTIANRTTDANGSVNERLSTRSRGSAYYRWRAQASAGYNASNSSAILVRVR